MPLEQEVSTVEACAGGMNEERHLARGIRIGVNHHKVVVRGPLPDNANLATGRVEGVVPLPLKCAGTAIRLPVRVNVPQVNHVGGSAAAVLALAREVAPDLITRAASRRAVGDQREGERVAIAVARG